MEAVRLNSYLVDVIVAAWGVAVTAPAKASAGLPKDTETQKPARRLRHNRQEPLQELAWRSWQQQELRKQIFKKTVGARTAGRQRSHQLQQLAASHRWLDQRRLASFVDAMHGKHIRGQVVSAPRTTPYYS